MLSRIHSVGVRGVEGYPVLVELDLANGLPGFTTVGLPDSAVRESRERVTSAVRNSGYRFPSRRITVNLAPAQSRKRGTQYDLPIALAVLSASGQLPSGAIEQWSARFCFLGELALDGALRPVAGVLAMALQARQEGFEAIVVPMANGEEASAAGITTYGARTLREVADFIAGAGSLPVCRRSGTGAADARIEDDLSDVKGQFFAKRALEIAAAGGHHVLFFGPPGAGKSMLARRLVSILPPMTPGEVSQATRVHSACGRQGLVCARPFRSPHHSASAASLVGGGPAARPGEVSLAHGGVLFLDEVAEFPRASLEALRQPMEDHRVSVTRTKEAIVYPARFQLVAASNPCPCGWRGHPSRPCLCTPAAVEKYRAKLSGPLLDRIDIQVELPALDFAQWAHLPASESSAQVGARVQAARALQRQRFASDDFAVNAYIPPRELKRHCDPDAEALALLEAVSSGGRLSARGLDRALRVARTIADLADARRVGGDHVREAVRLRGLERWAGV